MKRDLDLIRNILEQVEGKYDGTHQIVLDLPGHSKTEIAHHVRLLAEQGFLDAADCSILADEEFVPLRLKGRGHDFLDTIRNDTVWSNVKETVKEKGGTLSLEVIKAIALKLAVSLLA